MGDTRFRRSTLLTVLRLVGVAALGSAVLAACADARSPAAQSPVDAQPPVAAAPEGIDDLDAISPAADPRQLKPERRIRPLEANDPTLGVAAAPIKPEREPSPTLAKGSATLAEPDSGLARSVPEKEPDGGAAPGGDGTAGARDLRSAQGELYSWHDGDRVLQVRLQSDLTARSDGTIGSVDNVVRRSDPGAAKPGSDRDQPVFRSESGGTLMALPGGVLLVLDPDWNKSQVDRFLAHNALTKHKVSPLSFAANGLLVETGPGFASLELANKLAAQDGVVLSSPNWWREATMK